LSVSGLSPRMTQSRRPLSSMISRRVWRRPPLMVPNSSPTSPSRS
jgi:hypothetical protein